MSQQAHASFSGVEQHGRTNAQIKGLQQVLAETEAVLEEIKLNGTTYVLETQGHLTAPKGLLKTKLPLDSALSKEAQNHVSTRTTNKRKPYPSRTPSFETVSGQGSSGAESVQGR